MYIPLQLRLTLFYTLVLGVALWFFGQTVYTQAEQRAYSDLDTNLSSRAASVRLGKDLFVSNPNSLPPILPSVDSLGTGGVSIEVMDEKLSLLATTSGALNGGTQTFIDVPSSSPVPWDGRAARAALQERSRVRRRSGSSLGVRGSWQARGEVEKTARPVAKGTGGDLRGSPSGRCGV